MASLYCVSVNLRFKHSVNTLLLSAADELSSSYLKDLDVSSD